MPADLRNARQLKGFRVDSCIQAVAGCRSLRGLDLHGTPLQPDALVAVLTQLAQVCRKPAAELCSSKRVPLLSRLRRAWSPWISATSLACSRRSWLPSPRAPHSTATPLPLLRRRLPLRCMWPRRRMRSVRSASARRTRPRRSSLHSSSAQLCPRSPQPSCFRNRCRFGCLPVSSVT